jgi:hypothetical protein
LIFNKTVADIQKAVADDWIFNLPVADDWKFTKTVADDCLIPPESAILRPESA